MSCPYTPPCGTYRGMGGDLHHQCVKSPPTGVVHRPQSPVNFMTDMG